jgi:HEAT repeats
MKSKVVLLIVSFLAAAFTAWAGLEQTVNDLLPGLAAAKVGDRYAVQMELQKLALNAARPGARAERVQLASILAAKAADPAVPQPARVWLVRQLQYIGGAESVKALTTLLHDPDAQLRECARRALEKNPAPAATVSLRAALKQGGDTIWTIGLIQSLGERRDTKAVKLIKPYLYNEDTASTATEALGKIADRKAVTALWQAYDAEAAGAPDALVAAGNHLLLAGHKSAARDLFKQLYLAGVPQAGARASAAHRPLAVVQVRSAALIGWATADPKSAGPSIAAALEQPDLQLQFAGVTAATAAHGKSGVSAALVPLLPKLPATAKVYVLRVLDPAAEKQVIDAAGDWDQAVQEAALERLAQIGSVASVPVLFHAALEGAPGPQKVATAGLARISGPGAGAAIEKLAAQGDSKSRALAIAVLARRYDQATLPALLQYAAEDDPAVSSAACDALGRMGTDSQLDGLAQLVLAGKTPGAAAALQAVAGRSTDKSAATQKLVALTRTAQPQQLAPLFDVLATLGGPQALEAISATATGGEGEAQDAAIRALANWPDFAATKSLLVIASNPNSSLVHRVLAIQAVARLVKSADHEPADARLDAALAAMKAATRDEDKTLLLSAFASVHDRTAAEAIKPYLSEPKFQNQAALAAIGLAESLRKTDRPTAIELAEAVKSAGVSNDLNRRADALLGDKKN